MIVVENTEVYGWEAAIRGARNPMNSWSKSDSVGTAIGPADLRLLHNLAMAGPDHGKFLRMITVTVDVVAPLYWWKEADQYRVSVTTNSCSTMHKIHSKPFEVDDFSHDMMDDFSLNLLTLTVDQLEFNRRSFIDTKDKRYWWQMIQLLPSSYNQRRTVCLNYAVLLNMYRARKNHKLNEWRVFCGWIERLPYFKEICLEEDVV